MQQIYRSQKDCGILLLYPKKFTILLLDYVYRLLYNVKKD